MATAAVISIDLAHGIAVIQFLDHPQGMQYALQLANDNRTQNPHMHHVVVAPGLDELQQIDPGR